MAKRKKKNKASNQGFFHFPDFMEVTPEIREVINSIKNPFTLNYVVDFLAVAAGLLFFYIYYSGYNEGLLGFYYFVFGLVGIAYGLAEFYFTFQKNLAFRKFLKRDKFRIIWIYTKEEYDPFYKGLEESDTGVDGRRVAFSMIILIILTLILLITLQGSSRIIAIPFGIICIGVVFVTSFVFPKSYILAAHRKPYISLVDDDMAYALGRYYRWEKALVQYRNLSRRYGIDENEMRISYQEPSLFGKKTPTFQVLIPNNDQYTIQFAKHVGKRINTARKELDKRKPGRKKDVFDKAFEKLMDSDDVDSI